MSLELLHIVASRDNYDRFNKYIKSNYAQIQEVKVLLKDIDVWYKTSTNRDDIDWDAFALWFKTVRHPTLKEDKMVIYEEIFEQLKHSTIPEEDTYKEILHSFVLRNLGDRLMLASSKMSEGRIDHADEVVDLLDGYMSSCNNLVDPNMYEVTQNIEDIVNKVNSSGLDWRLDCFNRSLGPVRPGDLIAFSGRPDSGKTTLLCVESNNFAKQLDDDKEVYIFNNDGSGDKYRLRLIQSELGLTYKQIKADPRKAHALYNGAIGRVNKTKIIDKKTMDVGLVNQKLKLGNPGLIIFDQLWKMYGFEKEYKNEVSRQGRLFSWAKELGEEYQCAVLIVHQADASAEGVQYPNMSQLYGVKTVAQGESDAIIMIGRTHEASENDKRWFNVAKNELIGGDKSDPADRNGKYEVTILPEVGQFKES